MTLSEIRTAGLAALVQSLGPVGMVRFMQQYDSGIGDYTKERRFVLGEKTVDEILAERRNASGK